MSGKASHSVAAFTLAIRTLQYGHTMPAINEGLYQQGLNVVLMKADSSFSRMLSNPERTGIPYEIGNRCSGKRHTLTHTHIHACASEAAATCCNNSLNLTSVIPVPPQGIRVSYYETSTTRGAESQHTATQAAPAHTHIHACAAAAAATSWR